MKKPLIIALWCALAVGGGVLYPFWGVRAAIISQNVSDDGSDWSGQTDCDGWSNLYGHSFTPAEGFLFEKFRFRFSRTTSATAGDLTAILRDSISGNTIATSTAQIIVENLSLWNTQTEILFPFDSVPLTAAVKYYVFFISSGMDTNCSGGGQYLAARKPWPISQTAGAEVIWNNTPASSGRDVWYIAEGTATEVPPLPPVITYPLTNTTINSDWTFVSGTCPDVEGWGSVFVTSVTGTQILSEGFASCIAGVWTTETPANMKVYSGGQTISAKLAKDSQLTLQTAISNVITIWGGAESLEYDATTTLNILDITENSLTDKILAPLTFFSNLKTKIDAISTATTSAFYLVGATTTAMMTNFFTPMKTGFAVVVWLLVAAYMFKRIAGLII